jgi:hypothetical protein
MTSDLPPERSPHQMSLKSRIAEIAETRAEIAATFVIDLMLIAVAIFVRWASLYLLHLLASPEPGKAIQILELILNIGPVGTTAILTLFDLGKRIKNGWNDLVGAR